jgi:protein O-mannosyl-transferase
MTAARDSQITDKRLALVLTGLLLTVMTLVCYWPCLRGAFFFDDEHFIQKNSLVQDLAHWPALYKSTVTQGANIKGNFYRPNQQMVYALLYAYFGQSTTLPYHLVPLLLHIGSGLMLLTWLRRLGLNLIAAATGAGIFLLHPVQTEAVCYISGLSDPLANFFIMIAILCATPQGGLSAISTQSLAKTSLRIFALGLAMIMALLSKESGVVLAPMLIAYIAISCLCLWRRPQMSELITISLVIILAAASVVAKFTLFKFGNAVGLTDAANPYTESLMLRLTTFVSVLWDYAVLIFWPKDLFYEKPYTAYEGLAHARAAFGCIVILAGIASLALIRRRPLVVLGVAFVVSALIPFSGVVPLNAMFLEHWLYTVMIGVSLLGALCAQYISKRGPTLRQLAGLVLVILTVVASARTMARSAEWADVEAFYLNEIAHAHNPGRIYNNLGMYYADQGDQPRAIKYYQLAASSDTGRLFAQPHHNLAMAYMSAGDTTQALAEFRAALQVDPQFIYSLKSLANLLLSQGDKLRAEHVIAAIRMLESGRTYDKEQFDRTVFDQ